MSHLSIAILRKRIKTEDSSTYEYLVQTNVDKETMFFDIRNIVIGGGFDFGRLKRQIIDYFELYVVGAASEANNYKGEKKILDVFDSHKLIRTNKREPFATAYRFTFSQEQVASINDSISSKNSDKWGYLEWLKPDEIKQRIPLWKEDQKFIFKERSVFHNSKFPNDLRASLRNIAKARDSGKLVIFAGAGVSVDSNVPMWGSLVKGLSNDLDENDEDSLILAQIYHEARGNKEYQERIQELLRHGNTRSNAIHDKIVEISPVHILTTNYDTHFEQVIKERGYKYSIVRKDSDLPYTKSSSLLLKMHGDFDERNIVLKTKDYECYSTDFPLIEGFVKGVFASKLVLFIGFSFDDPNLREIYKSVQSILDKDIQRPYFVTSSNDIESRQKFETDFGLKVIGIGGEANDSILDYFEKQSNSNLDESYSNLSKRGKEAFRFLDVVNRFDVIADSFEGLKTETLFVSSISRFEEFGAIPIKVLENIPPFNEKGISSEGETNLKAEINDNNYGTLASPNEALLEFLKVRKGGGSGVEFYSYKNDEDSNSTQLLDRCFKLVYMSLVYNICRKNDDESEVYKLLPKNSKKGCDCLGCLYGRSDYDKMLMDLAGLSNSLICSQTTSDLGLTEAYGYFKTGQFVKAYHTLEEVRNVSWSRKKFATFFLASFNQKKLSPFLHYSNCRESYEKELDILSDRIGSIDLDELLYELPLDKEVKYALKLVKEDDTFNRAKIKITKNYELILEVYDKYKKGGYRHSGSYYWYIVEQEHYILWNFYFRNRFFSDAYAPFIDITEKYLESMIASYKTSTEYDQSLNEISGYFLTTASQYARPSNLNELFVKYEVNEINLLDSGSVLKEFIEKFGVLVGSGFKESNFMGYSISENKIFSNALDNSAFFRQQMESQINNYLILFSRIKLTVEQANTILKCALNLIQSAGVFKFHNSLKFFEKFITSQIISFTEENVINTLKFWISKDDRNEDSIEKICGAIYNTKDLSQFLDEEFYIALIQRFKEDSDKRRGKKGLFSFYPLLNPLSQNLYSKIIVDLLLCQENNDFIITAYYWGIWDPNCDVEVFAKFTSNIKAKVAHFSDYEINNDGLPYKINDFSTWNDLINLTIMVYRYDLFRNESVVTIRSELSSNMFKWVLDPLEYDYVIFDSSWLFAFKSDEYTSVFRKSDKLKNKLRESLKQNFNPIISEIYFRITNEL